MHITTVRCLSDNYAYLVRDPERQEALVVDPGDASQVLGALQAEGLRLAAILSTHHHYDHTSGNQGLLDQLGRVPVYGHASEQGVIPGHSHPVQDGDQLSIAGLSVRVHHVPGHTQGAVAYQLDGSVFTGDTLFVAGCGRLFEGSAAQMHASLSKLAALPAETRVYCGHEYTVQNLKFARSVEPDNAAVREQQERAAELCARGQPTVPSTIGAELRCNPFLRTDSAEIRTRFRSQLGDSPSAEQVFAALRAAKDRF